MIFIGKISKGHNSVKNVYGIRVLFFFFFSFWNKGSCFLHIV